MLKFYSSVLKKEITIEDLKTCCEGSYGSYYQLDQSFGVKVIEAGKSGKVYKGAKNLKSLYSSSLWKEGQREYYFQNKSHEYFPENVDLCLEIFAIQKQDRFFPALLLSHVDGKDFWSLKDQKLEIKTRKEWDQKFLAKGLNHGDLNAFNLFLTPLGKVKIIDFGLMEEMEEWEKESV